MRRPGAIVFLLALLLALGSPGYAYWACPDGTPCFAGMPGCESHAAVRQPTCCAVPHQDAVPRGAALDADPAEHSGHCRLIQSPPTPAVVVAEAGVVPGPAAGALPERQFAAVPRGLLVTGAREAPDGCRPPPLRRAGPSRAPPAA